MREKHKYEKSDKRGEREKKENLKRESAVKEEGRVERKEKKN